MTRTTVLKYYKRRCNKKTKKTKLLWNRWILKFADYKLKQYAGTHIQRTYFTFLLQQNYKSIKSGFLFFVLYTAWVWTFYFRKLTYQLTNSFKMLHLFICCICRRMFAPLHTRNNILITYEKNINCIKHFIIIKKKNVTKENSFF